MESQSEAQISILLPVRNGGEFLEETLLSLQAQTFENFELILVNDGSTDDTAEIAKRCFAGDTRLRLLDTGDKPGLVPALQLGLHASRSEYIARMDGDDIALPRRLELQYALMKSSPEVSIATCQVQSFSEGELGGGYRHYDAWLETLLTHEDFMRERYVESPLSHPTVMFRRQAILDLGGYRDLDWPEDYDLWLRAAEAGLRFAKVNETLLRWRDYPNRTSRQDSRYSPEAFLRCRAHFMARGPLKEAEHVVLWGAGQMGGKLGRFLVAEGVKLRAFVDIDPRKIGNLRLGVPVIGPADLEAHSGCPLVSCVGSRGARSLIRERL
ncbi:MAG: glycosyltransferase, partial [Deltaproteobacteria bacterium]|nr:glycosyltransferase [Deltaproteobacteria bacterium]